MKVDCIAMCLYTIEQASQSKELYYKIYSIHFYGYMRSLLCTCKFNSFINLSLKFYLSANVLDIIYNYST